MTVKFFLKCSLLSLLLAACVSETSEYPSDAETSSNGTTSTSVSSSASTMNATSGGGGSSSSASSTSSTGAGEGGDAPVPGMASLTGTIDASVAPAAGGKGKLYVVVLDDSPITGDPERVGGQIIEDVDFSVAGATYPYTITDIPPSATKLYITAFLDDNGSADSGAPEPDKGDLVAMEGLSFPTMVMDQAQSYNLDITLSVVMPF